jgi:hypothetical protein
MSVTIDRIITHGDESLLVSAKRDLCLVNARMLGWWRRMFLDDDILAVATQQCARYH